MDTHAVIGLALVRPQAAGSKILLIRSGSSSASWALPTTKPGESLEQLLATIKADLLPTTDPVRCAETVKVFPTNQGDVSFQFATVDADLLPYFESDAFTDARWASFDEAFHIARLDHEAVIRWSERQAQKLVDRL